MRIELVDFEPQRIEDRPAPGRSDTFSHFGIKIRLSDDDLSSFEPPARDAISGFIHAKMGDILRLIEASLNTRNEDLDEVFRAFETRFINGDPPMFTRYESRGTPYAYWFWFCVVDFIKQYKPKGKPAESEGISPPKKNEKAPVKPANIHSEAKKWDATLKKEGLGIIHPSKRSFGPSQSREKREDTIVADRQAMAWTASWLTPLTSAWQ